MMSTINQTQSLIDKYFTIANLNELETLRNEIQNSQYPLQTKKKAYLVNKQKLDNLSTIFSLLVKERNELAKSKGFSNYYDFVVDWYGISGHALEEFRLNYSKLSNRIISEILNIKTVNEDYWSEYNNPTAFHLLDDDHNYKLPDDVYNFFKRKTLNFQDITRRIKLIQKPNRYFYTDYELKDKTVAITGDISNTSSSNAIAFAQEVGHAHEFIKLMDKKVNPDNKSAYWHEKKAIEKEIEFEETLDKVTIAANRDRVLYHYTLALFEDVIYKNQNINFSEIFANVHNKVYPSKQVSNPFYLLNSFLIDWPCYSVIYASVYTELLKPVYL